MVLRVGIVAIALCAPAWAARPADSVTGEWQGEYVCAQGSTGLTLSVEAAFRKRGDKLPVPAGATRITAVFQFYPVDANPSVPKGCFEMAGTVAAGTHRVELGAGRWLLHPAGYVTVDLSGQISPDGTTFDGAVHGPLCTSFTLHRLAGPRASTVASCQPEAVTASAQ